MNNNAKKNIDTKTLKSNLNNLPNKFQIYIFKYPKKKKCPNQIVAYITIENNKIKSKLSFMKASKRSKAQNADKIKKWLDKYHTILIVLESPHIYEYNNSYGIIAPAMGKTGKYLQSNFEALLCPHIENGRYRVILMNSIPYQCSLGVNPKYYRDAMWLKIWYDCGGRQDFESKLQKTQNAEYIFNLCTKGEHYEDIKNEANKKTQKIKESYIEGLKLSTSIEPPKNNYSIQSHVQDVIDTICGNAKRFTGPHPSSWWRALPIISKV